MVLSCNKLESRSNESIIASEGDIVVKNINNGDKYITINPEKEVYVDDDSIVIRFTLNDINTKLYVVREPYTSEYEVANAAYIDFEKGVFGFLKSHVPNDLSGCDSNSELPLSFVAREK